MNAASKTATYIFWAAAILSLWLFVGVVKTHGEWEECHEIFIKKIPTLKLVFFDPYSSDPYGEEFEYRKRQDANDDWLPDTYELNEFLSYCKHRYGITGDDQEKTRSLCKISSEQAFWQADDTLSLLTASGGGIWATSILLPGLFIGVVRTIGYSDELEEYFIKKIPTLKMVFFNPYKSFSIGSVDEYRKRQDANGDWLPGSYELNKFLSYCKHRYGIAGDDEEKSRSLCKIADGIS